MRTHPTAWLAAALLFAAALVAPARAEVSAERLTQLHELVTDWQVEEARDGLAPLLDSDPQDIGVRFVLARVLYFEGRYADALHTLDAIIGDLGGAAPPGMRALRDEVAATHDALKDFDEFVTDDGRFLVRFKGRDRLMVPYVLDVLQKADAVLSADFAYRPRGRIVVEIYPEIRYLAAVSPLTEEEIETSGTIALCKYNRLMFTSPRALVRGYGWQDTVAHEFVHYYVTKVSRNTVPIWLHEGIAKFQESRWRFAPGKALEPPQEDLLARSLKEDKLITFDQMHPSMAKLPSQEAASLAFAQVHTVIDFLHRKKGYAGLNALIGRLKAGDSMDAALQRAYGWDLDGLWTTWRAQLRSLGLKTYPGLVQTSLKFKRPGDPEGDDAEAEPEYATIEQKRVKDLAHIGELLRARDRHKAALMEYRKAIVLGGDGNPVVQNGAAASMLHLGRAAEVPETLERVSQYYPGFVNTHLHLGKALKALGRTEEAVASFEAAVGINPFHPEPHQALAELYTTLGRTELAARARKTLELLQ
ncbi:MAG: hypothetical protein H6704_00370 [Myxococcales bacterium]|nr:hypothetical protein [Myxococcales bacterium]